jgi:hypothetical protein
MIRDRKAKKNKYTKKDDSGAGSIEEQAMNLLGDVKLPDLDEADIPDELKNRLESADALALDDLEKELGIEGDSILKEREEKRKAEEEMQSARTESENVRDDEGAVEEEVAEPVDGSCTVRINDDKMNAQIDLIPSENTGVALDYEKIKGELAAAGVVFGVNEELLKKLIITVEKTKEAKEGVVIARGALPEEGKDGTIQFHFGEDDSVLDEPVEENTQPIGGVESE